MPITSTRSEPILAHATRRTARARVADFLTLPEVRWAAVATALFAAGGVLQLAGAPSALWWALYLGCYAAGGWEPALAGLQALRERTLDVDLLMIVAALVAAGIGQIFDGALLIVIFATSGALEAVATKRTADSVRELLDLTPDTATVLDLDGGEQLRPAGELRPGELVLIRPGERITADGTVEDGLSEVNQASVTGEPMPVAKSIGDEVFAGTLNGTGALRVRVGRDPADWVLARIVTLVEQASATKALRQLFIEKVEQRYSVGVVVATLALFFGPLAFGADLRPTLLRAMTFMIVASPCAVVLATMPPLLSAIANAGRHGVLVKSTVVLEQLDEIDTIVFDKTGTLTAGTPWLVGCEPLAGSDQTSEALLALAASVEQGSEHPLGVATVAAARSRGLVLRRADRFGSTPGRAVRAEVDGQPVTVGSPAVLDELPGSVTAEARTAVATGQRDGHTAVVVLIDEVPAGVLSFADRLRPAAAAAVAALAGTAADPASAPRRVLMLTGDNQAAADRVAGAASITETRAGLLPQQKVEVVAELQSGGARVLAIGDGVNDAAMLAAAHTGAAMGRSGADLTLESADLVLVRDELAALSSVLELSAHARRVIVANLVIAGTVILALVVWDLFGRLPLPLGVAGHEGSTVIVGLNGLRLLRARAWR